MQRSIYGYVPGSAGEAVIFLGCPASPVASQRAGISMMYITGHRLPERLAMPAPSMARRHRVADRRYPAWMFRHPGAA